MRGREPDRSEAVPKEPACEPEAPEEPDVTRGEVPEEDPPELEPVRDDADPDLPLEDDEGVRDPAGVCTRGASGSRVGAGKLDGAEDPPEEPPDEPEEPDELDPPAGRGIAWAYAAAGTANAIARAATTSERGFLSMTILLQ